MWHKADVAVATINVCVVEVSGHHVEAPTLPVLTPKRACHGLPPTSASDPQKGCRSMSGGRRRCREMPPVGATAQTMSSLAAFPGLNPKATSAVLNDSALDAGAALSKYSF